MPIQTGDMFGRQTCRLLAAGLHHRTTVVLNPLSVICGLQSLVGASAKRSNTAHTTEKINTKKTDKHTRTKSSSTYSKQSDGKEKVHGDCEHLKRTHSPPAPKMQQQKKETCLRVAYLQ